jgi:Bacterial mobilisation protein (MobC)
LLSRNFSELNRVGNNLNQTTRALNELVLIAREIGADRLMRIAREAIERSETATDELRAVMAENRRALGYRDREG